MSRRRVSTVTINQKLLHESSNCNYVDHHSLLYDFYAREVESLPFECQHAIVLDRTAFYPTSGGQVHDLQRDQTHAKFRFCCKVRIQGSAERRRFRLSFEAGRRRSIILNAMKSRALLPASLKVHAARNDVGSWET